MSTQNLYLMLKEVFTDQMSKTSDTYELLDFTIPVDRFYRWVMLNMVVNGLHALPEEHHDAFKASFVAGLKEALNKQFSSITAAIEDINNAPVEEFERVKP